MASKFIFVFLLFFTTVTFSQEESNKPYLPPLLNFILNDSEVSFYSGTIALPVGTNAGPGGATFRISTFPLEIYQDDGLVKLSNTTITINQGENSAPYSIELPRLPNHAEKSLSFECVSGCDNLDVTTVGSWSESVGIVGLIGADRYPNKSETVNIVLEDADSFSLTVELPGSLTASGDEFFSVTLRANGTPITLYSFSKSFSVNPGESSWPVMLGVPSSKAESGWSVRISCSINCTSGIDGTAAFATTVTGDPLSTTMGDAFIFGGNSDHSGITATFLTAP